MTSTMLDIDLVNPNLHERSFSYPSFASAGLTTFQHIAEWRNYLLSLQVRGDKVPTLHVEAFHAALRMMLLAWVEPVLIKAAELQALRSLESALKGAYFEQVFDRVQKKKPTLQRDKFNPGLGCLLDHAVDRDQLGATLHSAAKKRDGSALHIIRNALSHGELFNTLPWGGLFQAVREVMEHAHRDSR